MSQPPGPAVRRRRPFTLVILASLMLLKAAILFALVVLVVAVALDPNTAQLDELAVMIRENPALVGPFLLVAALLAAAGIGLLARRRTGWLLAMVLTGVFVGIDIYGFLTGDANHVWMALNIVTVFYLNQRDVREFVGAAVPASVGEPAG